jgi:hypothetical protein
MAQRAYTIRDYQRWARKGSTTQRGYGWSHVKAQRAYLAAWKPGDPCTRCGQPMWQRWRIDSRGRRVSALHLAHTPDRQAYEGLQHAYCNTSEGATRGNQIRGQAKRWAQSRQW